jgi:hypothetical protein
MEERAQGTGHRLLLAPRQPEPAASELQPGAAVRQKGARRQMEDDEASADPDRVAGEQSHKTQDFDLRDPVTGNGLLSICSFSIP